MLVQGRNCGKSTGDPMLEFKGPATFQKKEKNSLCLGNFQSFSWNWNASKAHSIWKWRSQCKLCNVSFISTSEKSLLQLYRLETIFTVFFSWARLLLSEVSCYLPTVPFACITSPITRPVFIWIFLQIRWINLVSYHFSHSIALQDQTRSW